jgi:RNA polymerase sigma factor (sigma-70 family)
MQHDVSDAGGHALASASLNRVLSRLRDILGRRDADEQTDGHLLELFLSQREEYAFELLVRRHGPMVLGVCRRILGNDHDAEDAFQATFLVLVRRGDRVRPRSQVGNWLYGVAYRTASELRRAAARRRRREAQVMPRTRPAEDVWAELRPLLDGELNRLPDQYRMPLVLCDLEGMTRKEAARQLGWAEGTVSSRLSRGRELLGRRLKRHGLALSGATITGALAEGAATAVLPVPLIHSTVKAAVLTAAGQTTAASVVAANAVALMEKVVRNMAIVKLKFAAAIVLVAGVVTGVAYQGLAEQPAKRDTANTVKAADDVLARAEPAGAKKEAEEEKAVVSVKEMPPVVVRTVPQAGDTEVDADKVKEIRVTFSKRMTDKSWSWVQISKETFPKHDGEIYYDKDRRTCVMPGVKLEPGKTYVIWLNSEQYGNFKDDGGRSAVPYLLVFETKPKP